MCGIIGYAGDGNVGDILISGLERLEYRGYDSAGMAVCGKDVISILKEKGKVEMLKDIYAQTSLSGNCGIAHTRWATHGKADSVNCHPHTNTSATVAVVHNGIIENHNQIRNFLIENGYEFISQTDTETIPHLIDYYYNSHGDFLKAVMECARDLEGSYAIGIVSTWLPEKIVAVCRKSPLIIGEGESGSFICSDINALSHKADKVYAMEDGEFAVVGADTISFFSEKGTPLKKTFTSVGAFAETVHKGEYSHFMLKEIYQQPHIIRKMISENVFLDRKTCFSRMDINAVKKINKIFIVGCGTAYHSALVGKQIIEMYAKIPVEVSVSSEFRYANPLIDSNTFVMAVTQSGETADTIAAIDLAKERGCKTSVITNTPRSTATRMADYVFLTSAGAEISVASTKAYSAQLASFYIFALFLAENIGDDDKGITELKKALLRLPKDITSALSLENSMKVLAGKIADSEHLYYIGRGLDGITAKEGALKMKEITYIHAEAYKAGELKHGPIALIEKGTTVIALDTDIRLHAKISSAISEVGARGAIVYCFSPFDEKGADVISIPETHFAVTPFVAIVPLQLLAYYTALERGCDADKPRNLAKSVTVE